MLSVTSEYALRAMIYLATHESDWPITGRTIAEQAQIPPRYLSKILGDLVRCGVLDASPGRTGGFRLRRSAQMTLLYDVLAPFEHLDDAHCPFGQEGCNDRHPCKAHERWAMVQDAQQRFFRETSVHDVAFGTPSREGPKRRRT